MWSTSVPSKPLCEQNRTRCQSVRCCNERIVLQLLLVVQSDDVEVRRRLDTFKVRLQGAEGVTTYEYHDHEERKRNRCRIRTQTRASQQS